jgi:hypothetical protein
MPRADRHFLPGHVWHITRSMSKPSKSHEKFLWGAIALIAKPRVGPVQHIDLPI